MAWHHYLLEKKFMVISDQKTLKFLIEQREVQAQFQSWLTKLLGNDFEILYQPGLQNKATDSSVKGESSSGTIRIVGPWNSGYEGSPK